jgi:hypothetical protein
LPKRSRSPVSTQEIGLPAATLISILRGFARLSDLFAKTDKLASALDTDLTTLTHPECYDLFLGF